MDFSLPNEVSELRDRTRQFVIDKVIPFETDPRLTSHGPSDDLRRELNALAKNAGLLVPHLPPELGGLGLTHVAKAAVFEAAGYSTLGPIALHIAAPDEGNIHLLHVVATEDQKARYLAPLAAADTRSCFCMTEPHPGAGSDPSLLKTTAAKDGEEFVINGVKWLITGAEGAGFTIVMAVADTEDGAGATMFLMPMDTPGIEIVRTIDSLDSSFTGGHAVVRFNDVRVPESAVLGEVGQGFRYAQVRLAPARLTHCMRWLGAAERAHDIAASYAARRQAFGSEIGKHEGIGFMLADNVMDMTTARFHVWHTAWLLDQGDSAGRESGMAKVVCSEAIWRVADRSVQILGGLGVTGDTVVESIFREARSFRIYDGPSEVHRWALAKSIVKKAQAEVPWKGKMA